MTSNTPQIGIFWLYHQHIIYKSICVTATVVDSLGNADAAFSHIEQWEIERIYLPEYPALRGTQYQELPRGRIIYDSYKKSFKLFADLSVINSHKSKLLVLEAFNLQTSRNVWLADPHYRTFSA